MKKKINHPYCCTLDDGLDEQMRNFVAEYPDTVLVVIDTFQMIRLSGNEVSYVNVCLYHRADA